jgi:hypothetical protein
MTRPTPALRIVAEPPIDAEAESARVGKHVCDDMRSETLARDWSAVHVAAERRRPIDLPESRKRGWWK